MPTIPNDAPRIIAMAISLKINANKPLSGDEEIINDPDLNPNYYFDEVTIPMNRSPEPHAPQAKTPKNSNVTKTKNIWETLEFLILSQMFIIDRVINCEKRTSYGFNCSKDTGSHAQTNHTFE